MPIQFNFVGGSPDAVARFQAALDLGRTSNTFNAVESQLVSERTTSVNIDLTGSMGRGPVTDVGTNTIYLNPDYQVYANHADGTYGTVPDAATLGHELTHLTSDRLSSGMPVPIYDQNGIFQGTSVILFFFSSNVQVDYFQDRFSTIALEVSTQTHIMIELPFTGDTVLVSVRVPQKIKLPSC